MTAATAFRCRPPSETTGVGAFRVLANGQGRSYTLMDVPSWQSIEWLMRQAEATGALRPCCAGPEPCSCYAVLDLYDDSDGIIQDFCIPTARAFRWWYRKVGWRVQTPTYERQRP
jgi:hypothetical protein